MSSDVDHRADLYALGAVAFEILSADRPYNASNIQELIYHHVTTEPTDLRTVAPEVPEPVNAVVMGCLAKDREKTIDSARTAVSMISDALPGAAPPQVLSPATLSHGVASGH